MPSPISFRLSFAVLVALAGREAGAQLSYTVTDLGVGSGGAIPEGINNYGQVVGATSNGGNFGNNTGSAFLWQPNTENGTTGTVSYPFPATGAVSFALGINSMGQFIGYNSASQGSQAHVFLFTPTVPNSAIGSLATLPIVPPPPSTNFSPDGSINDAGEVVAEEGVGNGGVNSAIFSPTNPNGTNGYDGGLWKGTGITSSTAAAASTHLTAVGVILNTNALGNQIYGAGTGTGLFEGANAELGNCDAVVTAQLAASVGTSAVPEPTTLALIGIGALGLLGRKSRRHR